MKSILDVSNTHEHNYSEMSNYGFNIPPKGAIFSINPIAFNKCNL